MLISVQDLKKYWGVNPQSIVHVGAHNAEELDNYARGGWGPVIWIEAQPQKVSDLLRRIPAGHKIIEAAVWDTQGESLDLKIMTNTESTSLLNLGTHAKEHPTIQLSHVIPVKTDTLTNLLKGMTSPDLLTLDIQGVELRAIKGYKDRISEVKWIYCEVNRAELYEGCALISEIDFYLEKYGFKRVATKWTIHNWGDALYVNRKLAGGQSLYKRLMIVLVPLSWQVKSVFVNLKHLIRILTR